MASVEPVDVVDHLLWRDAQEILARHTRPDHGGRCPQCGQNWPCTARRCAERADAASRRPWNEAWTARHDLRTLPGGYGGGYGGGPGGRHRAGSNRRSY